MSKHEHYTSLGSVIGGALVGLVVFGYLGMRFFDESDGLLIGIIATSGAVIGGWFQLRRGDLLWHRISDFFRWW